MVKFVHIYKNFYLGLSLVGILAFVIQEIPYMVMPLIKPEPNPIMNMPNEIKWIGILQGILGTLSMVLLMLLVRSDETVWPVATARERFWLVLTVAMLLINFVGWAFYYTGHQYGWLIVISQFAVVPLYYVCIGLWRSNYSLAVVAGMFFVIHTVNGYLNFGMKI